MHEAIGIPACFSSGERAVDDQAAVTRSSQSVFMSVYRTKIAGQCRLITITWCKDLLLHGLSVSVQGPDGDSHYQSKVELKPWYFWRKQGSKHFTVDGKTVDVVWDLKAAKFNGETEPRSDYYVAIVCEEEVVLLLGDLKKDAYRKTGCRPALIEPTLVSRKEHLFGKKKFSTKVKFHEKGNFHEISIECNNSLNKNSSSGEFDHEMEIRIDGRLANHVKHLQWKFRGNESVYVNKTRVEVYWDVHDWLFSSGPRQGLFIFKPISSSTLLSTQIADSTAGEECSEGRSSKFCSFLYAWKVEWAVLWVLWIYYLIIKVIIEIIISNLPRNLKTEMGLHLHNYNGVVMICIGHWAILETRERGLREQHMSANGPGRIGSLLQLELTKMGVIGIVQNRSHMLLPCPLLLQYPFSIHMFGKQEFCLGYCSCTMWFLY